MKLYVDESGNTGEVLFKNSKFNFLEQPYYTLAGILVKEENKIVFENFIKKLLKKHCIQGKELKAKNLYESKPKFLIDLVDYILKNEIPFFIELMDKFFFVNTQIVDYLVLPCSSFPISNDEIIVKRHFASIIGRYLTPDVYEEFIKVVKNRSNESLEAFFDKIIKLLTCLNESDIRKNIEMTRDDYFDKKEENPEQALNRFLPIPEINSFDKEIPILPNYSAFTNLIGRANKFTNNSESQFDIIHDEQKQFDKIFNNALEFMPTSLSDQILHNSLVSKTTTYKTNKLLKIEFVDSKKNLIVQVSDILAGFVMRFWSDYKKGNMERIEKYLPVIKKIYFPVENLNIGINFVVPRDDLFF